MYADQDGSLGRGASIAVDVDRTYRFAIVAAVFQNHEDALVDERAQVRVLAAAFLYDRSQLRLECRSIDALRFGIQKRVHGGQFQSRAGPRPIQPRIRVNVGRGSPVSLPGDLREPSFE